MLPEAMINGRGACSDHEPLVSSSRPSPLLFPALPCLSRPAIISWQGCQASRAPGRFPGQAGSFSTSPLPLSLAKGPCGVE